MPPVVRSDSLPTPVQTIIYVTADIGCTGLERRILPPHVEPSPECPGTELIFPADLGLSGPLSHQLVQWQNWYDGVVTFFDFVDARAILGQEFDEIGQQLAESISAELGAKYQVVYRPQGGLRETD